MHVETNARRASRALIAALALATTGTAFAAPLIRNAAGANPAAIQAAVDQFRTDIGGVNNGVGGSFQTGRREINWDGVPDGFSAPSNLPADFFNVNSARGVVFQSPCSNTAGERIARVAITSGNARLAAGNADGVGGIDVVAMDDFIYGEPRPLSGCIFQDSFECAVSP